MNIVKMCLIEKRKNKGRKNVLILLAFVLFEILYFTYGEQRSMNTHPQGWLSVLYYAPLLNSIFLPTIIAILASRHMDIEHRAESFKLLYTFTKPEKIFFTKICYGSLMLFGACLLQVTALLGVGKYLLFPSDMPIPYYIWYFATTFIVSEILYLLQSILSFFFANQAVSICTGLAGSLGGVFLLYLPEGIIQRIIPWGLYGCTLAIRMDWNRTTRAVHFYQAPLPFKDLLVCFLWLFVLLCLALIMSRRVDIDGADFLSRCKTQTKSSYARKTHFHLLPSEIMKMKSSPAWLALLIIPAISAVIGTINFTQNQDVLSNDWYCLWSQHTLFLDFFFLPILLGVFISSIWRVEHNGTNWNQIAAHVQASKLVLQKFLTSLLFSALTILWIFILYFACGKYAGIPSPLPEELINWILFGFLGSCCVVCIQLFLSLIIRNFVLPIGLGFAGSIAGLLFTIKVSPYILPYSLMSIGMRANNPHFELDYRWFLPAAAVNIILWLTACIIYISHSDVQTHE